jgi:F0F1-type ATP synthase membrane subunit c/vacuolar-type H+-ATPase subunit K
MIRLLFLFCLLFSGCTVVAGAGIGYAVGTAYGIYAENKADKERALNFKAFESVIVEAKNG